jgi:hypothetical protein
VSLLALYANKPSAGQYAAVKHVLAYLQGTLDRGTHYTQGGSELHSKTGFTLADGGYTYTNWGPQDASQQPKEDETVHIEEAQSLLGYVIFQMGCPVSWGCIREKKTASHSSCESALPLATEGAW